MGFREDFINELKQSKNRGKEKQKEYEKSLLRTDEEWKIVENYLKEIILRYAKYSKGNKWVAVPKEDLTNLYDEKKNRRIIYLDCDKKKRLIINYKDVQRFCKENHMKLKYKKPMEYYLIKAKII